MLHTQAQNLGTECRVIQSQGGPLPERLKPRAAGSGPQAQSLWLGGLRAHQAQGQLDARFPSTKLLASVLTPKWLNPPPARERPKPSQLDQPAVRSEHKAA